ncbi:MAG: aldehyde dehydrogenase, partial [Micromonosporaceae bacterium]|nr:aldehyde dehydrogenase [Micromonosporaceae bacterium]
MAVTTPGLEIEQLLTDNTQLIGGEWVPAASGMTLDVINPATTEVLLRVPRGDANDIDAAAQAAQAAFPAWRDLNPSQRGEVLYRWGQLCREHAAQISTLESMEVGHPYWGPSPVGDFLIYTAGMADKVRGETLPTKWPSLHAMTWREPYGVVGVIIPWNGPAPVMTFDVAPALAAGNTVVVKPAEDAPLACLYVAKLGLQAGLPPGVLNLVTGYGPEAGAPLAGHPLVRRMSFTGSPETGSKIMEQCARHLIPLHVESGGKSPQIVFRDADLDKAIPGIVRMITLNTGQVCAAGSRLLVDPTIRKDVVGAIKDAFGKVRVGPWHDEVDMGPLINAKQEKRVLSYMDIGREEGAEVIAGGAKLTGE